jgi:hypothetical protein
VLERIALIAAAVADTIAEAMSRNGRDRCKPVTSRDSTMIAFDCLGEGPHLVLVGGALQHRAFDPPIGSLADRLSEHFTVFNYDRRGRGDSGDTPPYVRCRLAGGRP